MLSLHMQLRQIFRRLRREPMFTAVTLATLAVGVGANTAIFSVLDGILIKPLPYPKAEQLVGVWHTAPGVGIPQLPVGPSNYFVYREQSRTLEDFGVYTGDSVNVTGIAEPEQVRALTVTDGVLPILGVHPFLGRTLTRQDDSPGAPPTVMLGYGYWRRKFGADASILGRSLTVDGKAREIVGILPQSFTFMGEEAPLLVQPFQFDRNKTQLGNFSFQGVARLKPGVTVAQASADIARLMPIVSASFPPPPGFSIKIFEQARLAPILHPLKQDVVGDIGNVLWVLMGTIGIVLLIACANIANLLLVRAEGRQQELAIRSALGAGWTRIAGELLLESVILGLVGCALGLGLAKGALRALIALAPAGLPRLSELGLDASVLLFAVAISLGSSLLFGAIPILKYAGSQIGTGLRAGSRSMSQSRERHRARSVLVVVQVALALVLLIGSGLMIRTFWALNHVSPGFTRPAEVQTLQISIPDAQVADAGQVARMEEQILRKIAAIPGVTAVGIGTPVPLTSSGSFDPIFAEDRRYREGELPPVRRFKFISPGWLTTLGTPLIAGRDLTWTDIDHRAPIALVSEALAREYWQTPDRALGKRIRVASTDNWREIVGVVADVRDDGLNRKAPASVYWPFAMTHFWGNDTLVRRTISFTIRGGRTGAESFLREVRQSIWSVDRNLPLADVLTLDAIYRKSMARTSFTLVMLGTASAME